MQEEEKSVTQEIRGSFIVDNSSYTYLFLTAAFFVIFLFVKFSTAIYSENGVFTRTELCKTNLSAKNMALNVDLMLASLTYAHENIVLEVTAIRKDTNTKKNIGAEINFVDHYLVDQKISFSNRAKTTEKTFVFDDGSKDSHPVMIYNITHVKDFDQINIQLSLLPKTDALIKAYKFSWHFVNKAAGKYIVLSQFVLIFMVLFMLAMFIYHAQFAKNVFTQVFCSVMGIISFFCSVPTGCIISNKTVAHIVRCIFTALLVSGYRFFCAHMINTSANNQGKIENVIMYVLAGFYTVYLAIAIPYYKGNEVAIPLDAIVFVLHIIEAMMCSALIVRALISAATKNARRLLYFSLMFLLNIVLEFGFENGYVCNRKLLLSYVETDLWSTIHVIFSVFILYFMQINVDENYAQIDGENGNIPKFIDLEDENDSQNFDEDDETKLDGKLADI